MKKRMSVLFLTFLLLASLLQCYAAAEKHTGMEENDTVARTIEYEKSRPAVRIPNYIGGSLLDKVSAIVHEGTHIAYIAGTTHSTNFPNVNGYQEQNAGISDCFVMKMNITSNEIIYSTYVGGNATEVLSDIAVDNAGNVYAAGTTTSYDFPNISAYQPEKYDKIEHRTDADGFVFKLSATGDELLYSTFYGVLGDEFVNSIDIDNSGNAYVVGGCYGANLTVQNGYDQTRWLEEGWLLCLNSTGNGAVYGTYIGGSEDDVAVSVAVDDSGNAYVAATTTSDDIPELNGYDESYNGQIDCFVVKVNATGTGTIYSTYLGGAGIDEVASITVDDSGCVYGTGYSASSDLPTVNAYDDSLNGFMDCILFKLSQDGQSLLYSSYFGGSGNDFGTGIAIDSVRAAYITGYTDSDDYPLMNAHDSTFGGVKDCIVSKFNITTGALEYSTYLGGSGDDSGQGISINSMGDIFVAGNTDSTDFPTLPSSLNGGTDCFVIVLIEQLPGPVIDIIIILYIGVAVVVVIAAVICVRRR
ncbi:MAG: SBBP repeat-containing protein [Candidatus Thorarchaeota archaeon]